MHFLYNELIFQPKPESGNRAAYCLLGGFLLLCLVLSGPNVERSFDGYEDEANVTTWLSKEKAEELMRFHGTNGIKITSDRVYIKRDGRWICVYQDPSPLLPHAEDRRASAPSAAGIVRDGS